MVRATTVVAGVPEMTGGRLLPPPLPPDVATVSEKGGNEVCSEPSLALMTMPDVVPTLPLAGVPESRPVEVLKVAHAGRLAMDQVRARPSGSLPDGVKL